MEKEKELGCWVTWLVQSNPIIRFHCFACIVPCSLLLYHPMPSSSTPQMAEQSSRSQSMNYSVLLLSTRLNTFSPPRPAPPGPEAWKGKVINTDHLGSHHRHHQNQINPKQVQVLFCPSSANCQTSQLPYRYELFYFITYLPGLIQFTALLSHLTAYIVTFHAVFAYSS